MKEFTDIHGRSWRVILNVQQVRSVRDILSVDLYKSMADDFALYNRILGDPVLLVDLLFCLCREQATAESVTDEEFGRAMAGDAIAAAANAFTEELIDFFPDARMRAALHQTMEKAAIVQAGMTMAAMEAVERVNPEQILATMRRSSGNLPASSASIPEPSASGSSHGCSAAESDSPGITAPT